MASHKCYLSERAAWVLRLIPTFSVSWTILAYKSFSQESITFLSEVFWSSNSSIYPCILSISSKPIWTNWFIRFCILLIVVSLALCTIWNECDFTVSPFYPPPDDLYPKPSEVRSFYDSRPDPLYSSVGERSEEVSERMRRCSLPLPALKSFLVLSRSSEITGRPLFCVPGIPPDALPCMRNEATETFPLVGEFSVIVFFEPDTNLVVWLGLSSPSLPLYLLISLLPLPFLAVSRCSP